MALREHFETSGTWLFNKRSYFPVALLPLLALGLFHFHYPNDSEHLEFYWELFCFAVGLCGLMVRSFAVGFAAPHTSGRVRGRQEAQSLNMTGMYSVVRHPLYLGNYLMWISVAMLPRSVWIFLTVSLAFWLFYERVMSAEEAFLRKQFGTVFETWSARVPAFFPRLTDWKSPGVRFDLWRVANNEKSSIVALVVMFAAFNVVANRIVKGIWEMHMFWALMLVLAVVFYAVLRVNKEINKRRRAS